MAAPQAEEQGVGETWRRAILKAEAAVPQKRTTSRVSRYGLACRCMLFREAWTGNL